MRKKAIGGKEVQKQKFNNERILKAKTCLKEKEEVVKEYFPLIKRITDRIAARLPVHANVDDLFIAGTIGLLDAIKKFDPNKKVAFETYAYHRISGAILDELREMDWMPRSVKRKVHKLEKTLEKLEKKFKRAPRDEETAKELGINLNAYYKLLAEIAPVQLFNLDKLAKKGEKTSKKNLIELIIQKEEDWPEELASYREIRARLMEAIIQLPPKELITISLYYFDDLTLKEIGEYVLGSTESRACQLHKIGLRILREKLKEIIEEAKGEK